MALGTGNRTRAFMRVIVRATAYSALVLAAGALFGTAGISPAMAQVKVPPKAKLKAPAKTAKAAPPADSSDNSAAELNAKWQQENGAFAGFQAAKPAAVVPVSYATAAVGNEWGERLVSNAMKYLGTPYLTGGITPGGFDCSGFVYYLYRSVLNHPIGRMPNDMAREGTPVERANLRAGDIVFFGFRGTFTHVGIYAGNGQFVHATHHGSPVSVTALDSDYYRQHYMMAVRLPPQ